MDAIQATANHEERHRLFEQLASMDTAITPDLIASCEALFRPLHAEAPADIEVRRDICYGPHERNRLDIFRRRSASGLPVVMFVHGGGFVAGDKRKNGSPFYDNIGLWAANAGFLGITMTYRLAPDHTWPSGADDVESALRWIKEGARDFGGDPTRIFVMGHSAGATHVAGWLSREVRSSTGGVPVLGIVLISGIYDLVAFGCRVPLTAYFGADPAKYAAMSPAPGLVVAETPLFIVVAQRDPAEFQRQGVDLLRAAIDRTGQCPRFLCAAAHNHLSQVYQINSRHDTLGPQLLQFFYDSMSYPGP